MILIKRTAIPGASENTEKLQLLYTAGGNVIVQSLLKFSHILKD